MHARRVAAPFQSEMDAIKILGSLLGNNAMGSSVGGSILEVLLSGSNGRGQSGAASVLGTLLGGQRRSSGGGLGALGAILATAAATQAARGRGQGGGDALDVIGGLLGGGAGRENLGGLGGILGGQKPQGSGLEQVLGGLLGGGESSTSGQGGDLLGALLGGGQAQVGGGLGAILGAVAGAKSSTGSGAGSEMLGLLLGGGEKKVEPPSEAQEEAEILIRAMCNAAKADGSIDEAEGQAILGRAGDDLDESEIEYLREQLQSPLDIAGFLDAVPADMAEQVYAFSLMAIRLDTRKEAEYFAALAQGLGIDAETANEIHERLGQPEIFAA